MPTISNYDLNSNGFIDAGDLVTIKEHFNEITNAPYPPYDVNTDGVVNILDATIVGWYMGNEVLSLTISSNDGLNIKLANNGGNIEGVSIDGTELPLLPMKGGFSFGEVLTDLPNLVANPGFEKGISTPINWTFAAIDGNLPVWDTISHSGGRSIKISIPDTVDRISGYLESDIITAEPLNSYTISAWFKSLSEKCCDLL